MRPVYAIVAAYNEGVTVGAVVRDLTRHTDRVVVVDDGSVDNTSAEAAEAGAIVLRHCVNLGQGAALQTGFDFALSQGAAAVVTFDADGQMSADELPTLLAPLKDVDVALGSRFLGNIEGVSLRRLFLLKLAVRVSNALSGLPLTDAHCGLRAFRAQALRSLQLQQPRMAHASELLRKICTQRLRWVEVPVTIRYTAYSKAKGQSGLHALRILLDLLFR